MLCNADENRRVKNGTLTQSVVHFDGLFDVGRVRFAGSINSEDPEGILLSISQACHHVVEVRTLFWGLICLNPFNSARLLVLNKVAKDPAFAIMAGHLPLKADRVLGLVVGLWGHWRAGAYCEEKISKKTDLQTVNYTSD